MIDQKEIHRKSCSKYVSERAEAADEFVKNHNELPNKRQMWADITRLARSEDPSVYGKVDYFIAEQISKKTYSEDVDERFIALVLLRNVTFSKIPDKYRQKMWECLVKLVKDPQDYISYDASSVLSSAFSVLSSAFYNVENKQEVWNSLRGLTNVQHSYARYEAATVLVSSFSQTRDEQEQDWRDIEQDWRDIYELVKNNENHDSDTYIIIERAVANSLGGVFTNKKLQKEQKEQAWEILHKFSKKEDVYIRRAAAKSLGTAFSFIPDERKEQAWGDLRRLVSAKEDSIDVKKTASISLGFAYPHIRNKDQAYKILIEMTKYDNKDIKVAANYSLGRIHIFKASEAEKKEDRGNELAKAIEFFEIVSKNAKHNWLNPARFCLPFYRPYFTIVHDRKEIDVEKIDRDLLALKIIIERSMNSKKISKSKEKMLEILENINDLVTGMKDRNNSKDPNYDADGEILRQLEQYCIDITDTIVVIENDVPAAAKIIKEDMKPYRVIIDEIQKKALEACRKAKGTTIEPLVCGANETIQKFDPNGNETKTKDDLERYIPELRPKIKEIYEALGDFDISKLEEKDSKVLFLCILNFLDQLNDKFDAHEAKTDKGFRDVNIALSEIKIMLERSFNELTKIANKMNDMDSEVFKAVIVYLKKLAEQRDEKAEESLKMFSLKTEDALRLFNLDYVCKHNAAISGAANSDMFEQEVKFIESVNNFSWENIQNEFTKRIASISVELPQNLTVALLTEIILKSVIPIVLNAIPYAPLVSPIVNLLLTATK